MASTVKFTGATGSSLNDSQAFGLNGNSPNKFKTAT